MKYRPLGDTGMMVSEIGLGAWQLANPDWGISSREEALQIVHRSLEAGCNFFDTAPAYGRGVSEELLGQGLKKVRREIVLCTKVGHSPDWGTDFSTSSIRTTLVGSLRRLQTDYVDVLLLHNPPRELMDGRQADQYAELEKLKSEGKLRAYGVSLDWRLEVEQVVETTRSQALEVLFNAFYQEPLPAFPKAQERGVGLIVKVPLDSGWLSGRYRGNARFEDVRRRWDTEVIARRGNLVEKFAELLPPGTSMAHAALQFCLAFPEVSTLIPGAKSVAQALDNFAASDGRLDGAAVKAIQQLWEREIAPEPLPW